MLENYKHWGTWSDLITPVESGFKDWDLTNPTDKRISLIRFAFHNMIDDARHYHSIEHHIIPMVKRIVGLPVDDIDKEVLFWCALYHDVIYDVKVTGGANEIASANLWVEKCNEWYPEYEHIDTVKKIILATYGHDIETVLGQLFIRLDLSEFLQPFDKILEDELLIRKEYPFVDWAKYKEGRINFLNQYADNAIIRKMGVSHVLRTQAEYMKFVEPKIAVYPGTFYPFHVGHMDVLLKAEAIFDKVIVVFAENADKAQEAFTNKIIPKALQNRQVEFVSGSIIKWIENLEYPVTVVRGLRNSTDLQAEQNYLTWLEAVSTKPFKSVTVFADKGLEHISSSALKALAKVDPEEADKYVFK